MTVDSIWQQATESFTTGGFTGTLGTQFSLSAGRSLTGIWAPAFAGVSGQPSQIAIYDIDNSTQVSGTLNTSPSWGAPVNGWVKCAYSGPALSSGVNYAVAGFISAIVAFNSWSWPTTSGVITAPGALFSGGGSGVVQPGSDAGAFAYFFDVEVTPATAPAGLLMASGII